MTSIEDLKAQLPKLQKLLGYNFQDLEMLLHACTHCSFVNEYQGSTAITHNETLEFLGDSVLGLIVSEWLFKEFPEQNEGDLSSLRSMLVNKEACYQYIQHKDLEGYLLVGCGEKELSPKIQAIVYANFFEALLGALYVDAGFKKTKAWFLEAFSSVLIDRCKHPKKNYKALLQDWFQKKYKRPPQYQLISESGPEHSKKFVVHVHLDKGIVGLGEGSTKKEAEQHAAKEALNILKEKGIQ